MGFAQIRLQPERLARFAVGAFSQVFARPAKPVEQTETRREAGMRQSKPGIECNRLTVERFRGFIIGDRKREAVLKLPAAQIEDKASGLCVGVARNPALSSGLRVAFRAFAISVASAPCRLIASAKLRS